MEQLKKRTSLESLFILIIFAIFTITSFYIVLIGANVYKRTVSDTDANNEIRSSFAYIANKVRAFNSEGSISIGQIDNKAVLVLKEDVVLSDESVRTYYTYIYYQDGYMYEQLDIVPVEEVELSTGNRIVRTSEFKIVENSDGIALSGETADGVKLELSLGTIINE